MNSLLQMFYWNEYCISFVKNLVCSFYFPSVLSIADIFLCWYTYLGLLCRVVQALCLKLLWNKIGIGKHCPVVRLLHQNDHGEITLNHFSL